MPGIKTYPSIAADVDPATTDVSVGGYVCSAEPVPYHDDLPVSRLAVRNTGDRPVQVGSHFHFFEVNRALEFDRGVAFGQHLHIPASTALRFEPGDEREIELVPYLGKRTAFGFNNLVDGPTAGEFGEAKRAQALTLAAQRGFRSSDSKSSAKTPKR